MTVLNVIILNPWPKTSQPQVPLAMYQSLTNQIDDLQRRVNFQISNTPTAATLTQAFRKVWQEGYVAGGIYGIRSSLTMATEALHGVPVNSQKLVDDVNTNGDATNPWK